MFFVQYIGSNKINFGFSLYNLKVKKMIQNTKLSRKNNLNATTKEQRKINK